MGASRWVLQGILATPGKARSFGLSTGLILRLVIGAVTASATSYSATMLICHSTIAAQQQHDRDAENAAKRASAAAEKARLRETMLGALDAEMKESQRQADAVSVQLEAARHRRDTASQDAAKNQERANCQLNGGPGCRKGRGPQFNEALIREAHAADERHQAEGDLSGIEARLAAAERRSDEAVAAYRARENEFLTAAQAIDKRVAGEAVPERNDPLMSYMALQTVFDSPAGPAARFYAHLMLTLLLTVEVSYVLVSEYFGHATVYMPRLIARTKTLAAEAAAQYQRATALFRRDDVRPTLFRVFPRFKKPQDDEEERRDG
jgi:hypothetical protein